MIIGKLSRSDRLLEKNHQVSESDRLLLRSLRVIADYLMLKKTYGFWSFLIDQH
ncbi:MAG: hypothetical protein ACYTXA_26485 [Nostoc sp.]